MSLEQQENDQVTLQLLLAWSRIESKPPVFQASVFRWITAKFLQWVGIMFQVEGVQINFFTCGKAELSCNTTQNYYALSIWNIFGDCKRWEFGWDRVHITNFFHCYCIIISNESFGLSVERIGWVFHPILYGAGQEGSSHSSLSSVRSQLLGINSELTRLRFCSVLKKSEVIFATNQCNW